MSKETCPICGERVSNVLQHLVLKHNIKDPSHLKKVLSNQEIIYKNEEKESKKSEEGYELNWNTEFYKILSKLDNEKRIIYIEKELDEIIRLIDNVDNPELIKMMLNMLPRFSGINENINENIRLIHEKTNKYCLN